MKTKIKEKNGRLEIDFEDDHTLANLLRKALWEIGADSGYDKGHPYIGESTLVIKSSDPEKSLEQAIDKIENDLEEFREEFNQKAQ